MADGYAQATGRPAFLNLHTSAGLGNAIGNLTNARANRTPLVVTAGQQDYRHIVDDPLLSGPLVELAGGTVKWGHEVRTADELGTILRRAFQDAAARRRARCSCRCRWTSSTTRSAAPVPPPSTVDRAAVAGGLERLADLLTEPARRASSPSSPATRSPQAGAVAALVALAEALGAPVYGAPLHGRGVFPPPHPLWQGMLDPAAAAIAPALGGLRPGAPRRRAGLHGVPVHAGAGGARRTVELLHLSPDARPGRAGLARAARRGRRTRRATLAALLPLVQARADARRGRGRRVAEAAHRPGGRGRRLSRPRRSAATAPRRWTRWPPPTPWSAPCRPTRLSSTRRSPPVCTSAASTTGPSPGRYFFCTGGGLGWGMPAACGVSLATARPGALRGRRRLGDVLAAGAVDRRREQLPVVFAVVNNRQYLILKSYLRRHGRRVGAHRPLRRHGPRRAADRLPRAGRVDGASTRTDRRAHRRRRRRGAQPRSHRPAPRAPPPHHRP